MPAQLSALAIAELDVLELDEVLEVMCDYLGTRHRMLASGQRKLIAIWDNGHLRKALIEIGMTPDSFADTA